MAIPKPGQPVRHTLDSALFGAVLPHAIGSSRAARSSVLPYHSRSEKCQSGYRKTSKISLWCSIHCQRKRSNHKYTCAVRRRCIAGLLDRGYRRWHRTKCTGIDKTRNHNSDRQAYDGRPDRYRYAPSRRSDKPTPFQASD
jgi:hypothetical protein